MPINVPLHSQPADIADRQSVGESAYRRITAGPLPAQDSPLRTAGTDYLWADMWLRPGLDDRSRRLITLACVGVTGAIGPIQSHVHAALATGDLSLEELMEVVLQFAIYAGWPQASVIEQILRDCYTALHPARDSGDAQTPPVPRLRMADETIDSRFAQGRDLIEQINGSMVILDGSILDASVVDFLYGHVWRRPGLDLRARRWITITCLAAVETGPLLAAQISGALASGDIRREELDEFVLQFAAYLGWGRAARLPHMITSACAHSD
jgi:4-carboxymuconolactone decarboxylase